MSSIFDLFDKIKSEEPARSPVSWIVAGLGNPGPKYENTRHNAGFLAVTEMARSCGARDPGLLRFKALCAEGTVGDRRVLFLKPQTFMNLSGESIGEAARFYKIPPERVLVFCDDVALPPGRIRVRTKGSEGGHNGLKSISAHLGVREYPRIRIGVGAPAHPEHDMIDWVVGKLTPEEKKTIETAAGRAAEAAQVYITLGAEAAMSRFNGAPEGKPKKAPCPEKNKKNAGTGASVSEKAEEKITGRAETASAPAEGKDGGHA